jgi:hypothetical protein
MVLPQLNSRKLAAPILPVKAIASPVDSHDMSNGTAPVELTKAGSTPAPILPVKAIASPVDSHDMQGFLSFLKY